MIKTININAKLPNLLILGAAKAGTSTLFDLLKLHPDVYGSFDKEPRFFSNDDYFKKGKSWYQNTYFPNSANYLIRIEATPHYLYWADKVCPRIKNVYESEQIKFLIILRNPIERAYSWYWNMVYDGRETLPFLEALKSETSRLNENYSLLMRTGSMDYGYIRGSCYSSQIQLFFNDFPSSCFHVIFLEDLIKNEKQVLNAVFNHLEIYSPVDLALGHSNPAMMPKNEALHFFLRNKNNLKSILKTFIPIRLRYYLKSALLESNLEKVRYPRMEMGALNYLKENLTKEITSLSRMLDRDLSYWLDYQG